MDSKFMAGRVGSGLVLVAVLCAAIFFFLFPLSQGAYSVVHGPVTTLSSIRARLLLWLGMAVAAGQLLGMSMLTHCFPQRLFESDKALPPLSKYPEQITILRC
jgi:hypothetical protein